MPFQSCSVSETSRSITRSDSANLPMSCSRPAVWASSWSLLDIPAALAMSRENIATAAEWRAVRESRMSRLRTVPESTPHDSAA